MPVDAVTKRWIRGIADERAAENGCRFNEREGLFAVEWIQDYCHLYEGDFAGQPMILSDWQYEATMRMFGWQRFSAKWERWIRRFRQASIWIAKKNKKTPTLAAWGLYLLCGDKERGQKVFFAAKDGGQARELAGKHAIEMLMMSDALMAECVINKATCQITHVPSRSTLKPLASSNTNNKQSKEGLNGSLLIDETHVVDREFMSRIGRAGISRSEPFHIEVSTAGDNPDGYGKERFDYALKVQSGEVTDEELFVAIYAAPQDLTDADLAADPLKFGRMANPAMDHTIDPEEFLRDYHRQKLSLVNFGRFKQERLNIWQNSASPWIKPSDWLSCRRVFSKAELDGRSPFEAFEEELRGQSCWAGLDLSRTRDTTSLQLVFSDGDGGFSLLSYFWLPEETAREQNHLVKFLEWEQGGHIVLVPGNTIEFADVERKIMDLNEVFPINKLVFDPHMAIDITQRLMKQDLVCESFGQGFDAFARPTAEFERLVMSGRLTHPGNSVMDWQVQNATVRRNENGYLKPVKPKNAKDYRRVDGVVAAVMALEAALVDGAAEGSAYDRPQEERVLFISVRSGSVGKDTGGGLFGWQEAVGVLGVGLIAAGLWMIYLPLCLVWLGVACLATVLSSLRPPRPKPLRE